MTLNNEYFTFAIFRDCQFNSFFDIVVSVYKEYLENDIAIIGNSELNLAQYFNPSPGRPLDKFSFWTNPIYPDCVFFSSNFADGYISLCDYIRKQLHCELIGCKISAELSSSSFPMNHFHYISSDGIERDILAYVESSWVFYQEGQILPFENEKYYQRRKKKDRINYIIILEYLRALGFDFKNIDSKTSKCMTLQRIAW